MADVTISQLNNISPNSSAIIPISQNGSTYSTTLQQLSALPFIPKAWVNFDGSRDFSGASSTSNTNRFIKGSYNISSVLRNAKGDYTITFASQLPESNYAISGFSVGYTGSNVTGAAMVTLFPSGAGTYQPFLKSTSQVRISVGDPGAGTTYDSGNISIIIFG